MRKPSRRLPLSRKYKIQKRIREHHRKTRKQERKKTYRREKDIGIPNSVPYKKELLDHVEKLKENLTAEKELKLQQNLKDSKQTSNAEAVEEKLHSAQLKELEEIDQQMESRFLMMKEFASKSAMELLYYKVSVSDVILYLLDARNPLGCRCIPLEQMVAAHGKQLIYVLTKIDLIPQENLLSWMEYFSKLHPVIAIQSFVQTPPNVKESQFLIKISKELDEDTLRRKILFMPHYEFSPKEIFIKEARQSFGITDLWDLLTVYANEMDKDITVSVFGYYQVGKKALILSLVEHAKAFNNTPILKSETDEGDLFNVVLLAKGIKLFTGPGNIFPPNRNLSLQHFISPRSLPGSSMISLVEKLVQIIPHDEVLVKYKIPSFTNSKEFLSHLLDKINKTISKKTPYRIEDAAAKFIEDWNKGVFRYFSVVPNNDPSPAPPLKDVVSNALKRWVDFKKRHKKRKLEDKEEKKEESDEDEDDDDDDEDDDEDEDEDEDEEEKKKRKKKRKEEKRKKKKEEMKKEENNEVNTKLFVPTPDIQVFLENHRQNVIAFVRKRDNASFFTHQDSQPIEWKSIKVFTADVNDYARRNSDFNPFHTYAPSTNKNNKFNHGHFDQKKSDRNRSIRKNEKRLLPQKADKESRPRPDRAQRQEKPQRPHRQERAQRSQRQERPKRPQRQKKN